MERKEMTTKSKMFKKFIVVAVALVTVIALVSLVACETKPTEPAKPTGVAPTPATPTMAKNENGVWTAEAWKDIYPKEYKTFMDNKLNSTQGNSDPYFAPRGDMVAMYPMIKTIWNPSPFNTFYNEPNGHPYTLEDIRKTGRIFDAATQTYKATAFSNCYTCKSADFTAILQKDGVAAWNLPFGDPDLTKKVVEPVSCYNCHANNLDKDATVKSLEVTQPFFTAAKGSKVDIGSQTCGQCHNEYYFKPADRSVANPYSSLDNMNAQDMYEFYKTAGADGKPFNDYTNPLTLVGQLKTQHPEFEFIFGDGGSSMSKRTNPNTGELFGCADCHMGETIVEDGVAYTSHLLISPLENPKLLESTCQTAGCHTDLKSQVKAWQEESEKKVMSIGNKIEDLTKKLADAVANGTLDEAKLAEVRELNRQAVWYWDYVMVENSEGAHNPTLSNKVLGLSETAVDKALAYF